MSDRLTHAGLAQELDWRERLESKLDAVLAAVQPSVLTLKDIAAELETTPGWLRSNPWALPHFGVPDIDGRPMKWLRKTWVEWRNDLSTHHRRWELMTAGERTAAMRRVA